MNPRFCHITFALTLGCAPLLVDARRLASDKVRRDDLQASSSAAPDLTAWALSFMTGKCMLSRAQRWPKLRHDYADGPQPNETASESSRQAIVDIWELRDAIDTRSQNYNFFKKKFATKFSKKIAGLSKELKAKRTSLQQDFGLDYDGLEKHCGRFNGDETRACVEMAVTNYAFTAGESKALENVRVVMDLDELKTQRITREQKRTVQVKRSIALKALEVNASKQRFSYRAAVKTCRKKTEAEQLTRLKFAHEQVSTPAEQLGFNACDEKEDRYCPEGLAAVKKRTFDTVAAGAAFSFMYPASTVLFGVVGATLAAGSAMASGPAAIVSAAMLGFAGGAVAPGNSAVSAVTALTVGYARGQNECACFPRNCEYDSDLGSCAIGRPYANASKNPFARALPYQGLKCVPHHRKESACRYEPCATTDFQTVSPGALGESLSNQSLHGLIGLIDGGLYNCLSKSRFSTDALNIERQLPGGEENNAESRTNLYEKLGIQPRPDSQGITELSQEKKTEMP